VLLNKLTEVHATKQRKAAATLSRSKLTQQAHTASSRSKLTHRKLCLQKLRLQFSRCNLAAESSTCVTHVVVLCSAVLLLCSAGAQLGCCVLLVRSWVVFLLL
jgi:hypothetical protein